MSIFVLNLFFIFIFVFSECAVIVSDSVILFINCLSHNLTMMNYLSGILLRMLFVGMEPFFWKVVLELLSVYAWIMHSLLWPFLACLSFVSSGIEDIEEPLGDSIYIFPLVSLF